MCCGGECTAATTALCLLQQAPLHLHGVVWAPGSCEVHPEHAAQPRRGCERASVLESLKGTRKSSSMLARGAACAPALCTCAGRHSRTPIWQHCPVMLRLGRLFDPGIVDEWLGLDSIPVWERGFGGLVSSLGCLSLQSRCCAYLRHACHQSNDCAFSTRNHGTTSPLNDESWRLCTVQLNYNDSSPCLVLLCTADSKGTQQDAMMVPTDSVASHNARLVSHERTA